MINYGIWGVNGVIMRAPNDGNIGPTELYPLIKQQGYSYVLFDPRNNNWEDDRRIATSVGLEIGAWTRVRGLLDLAMLKTANHSWNGRGIGVNIEIGQGDGIGDTRDKALMAASLKTMAEVGHALVITDGWADPIGRWLGFKKWVGSVECFPAENPAYTDVVGCVGHASAFFKSAVPMLQTYGESWNSLTGRKPILADYNLQTTTPRILFTGDDTQNWSKW